eukprot:CAMPEP_0119566084 /NCGR_PEP_ID=MMETSP1352-20130426/32037_1 /TAXON_ID=265584 /ORGANISM="Stauroneis constricta, Strain CCMP1120" /LENGTH=131 /DNA_ID=CAMNT_0007615131 /DNA_START=193 /DNA_END=585 /DNA_ORIENTATION=-
MEGEDSVRSDPVVISDDALHVPLQGRKQRRKGRVALSGFVHACSHCMAAVALQLGVFAFENPQQNTKEQLNSSFGWSLGNDRERLFVIVRSDADSNDADDEERCLSGLTIVILAGGIDWLIDFVIDVMGFG